MIDFYDPIIAQTYPDPSEYDLIVLSGGVVDPMGSVPWQLKMQKFLRSTVREHPRQKIVGICWGHQTIAVTFGGIIKPMAAAEIGVHQIDLTEQGKEMFPFAVGGQLIIHEYHSREVTIPASGFTALAFENQAFLNDANTIMTFQGHPEMTENIARTMFENVPSYMGVREDEKESIIRKMELPHDGMMIWKRILEWVKEE
jgi:GMP synthase-like glutamine amidotransferase